MNDLEKDNFLVTVGDYYRKQRNAKGFSQDDVAEAADISTRGIQEFEKGKVNLSLTSFVQLSNLLDVPYSFVEEQFKKYLFDSYEERVGNIKRRKSRKF